MVCHVCPTTVWGAQTHIFSLVAILGRFDALHVPETAGMGQKCFDTCDGNNERGNKLWTLNCKPP